MDNKSAIIIGGGVGGLSAAWWLTSIGWDVVVLERAPHLRAVGYMLGLSGPGYRVAKRMGIMEQLWQHHRPIEENTYRDRDGKELWRARYKDLLGDIDWVTLSRTDLVETLYDAIKDKADVRFGVEFQEISQTHDSVVLTLKTGETLTAPLLIGADGINSKVRNDLFGPDASFLTPLGYRFAAFQLPDTMRLGHDFLSYAEPGRLTEFYTLVDDRLAALYAWKPKDGLLDRSKGNRNIIRDAYDGGHPDVLRLVNAVEEDQHIFLDDMNMIEMPGWSKGRVLLLGDAAHCLTLVSGQGAGMAIASACILAEELSKAPVKEALKSHEARLRPAIEGLQERSRKIGPLFIPDTERAFKMRNLFMKYAPRFVLRWFLSRTFRAEAVTASAGLDLD